MCRHLLPDADEQHEGKDEVNAQEYIIPPVAHKEQRRANQDRHGNNRLRTSVAGECGLSKEVDLLWRRSSRTLSSMPHGTHLPIHL